jgi:hypothetical protein
MGTATNINWDLSRDLNWGLLEFFWPQQYSYIVFQVTSVGQWSTSPSPHPSDPCAPLLHPFYSPALDILVSSSVQCCWSAGWLWQYQVTLSNGWTVWVTWQRFRRLWQFWWLAKKWQDGNLSNVDSVWQCLMVLGVDTRCSLWFSDIYQPWYWIDTRDQLLTLFEHFC